MVYWVLAFRNYLMLYVYVRFNEGSYKSSFAFLSCPPVAGAVLGGGRHGPQSEICSPLSLQLKFLVSVTGHLD